VEPGYKLSGKALLDVAEIVSYLHREVNPAAATRTENRLFSVFRLLARLQAVGHRRTDLTKKPVLFHAAHPYIIVLRRTGPTTQILRVVHGSRDLKSLLDPYPLRPRVMMTLLL
jgi:plasmid stabilization system protein ParE